FFCALFLCLLRKKTTAGLMALPFLEVVWVNMHGPAALAGLGLAGIYAVFSRGMRPFLRAYLLAATAVALFVNPNSYRVLSYLYTFFHEGFNRLILEHQPPAFAVAYIPYFILLALAVIALPLRGKKELPETLVLAVACAASLAAVRNIPLFAVLAAPLAAERFSGWRKTHFPSPLCPFRSVPAALAGAVLFSSFYFAGAQLDVLKKYAPGIGDGHRSRHAARFLAESGIRGRLFNDYDFGGYLIRKLYPGNRVFVDGRLVEYGARFVEKSFYYWKPEIWDELEGTYGFTVAVIPQESYYAASYLDRREDWVLVYWDDGALVYLKDVPGNRKYIRTFGYRCLKPNSPRQDYLLSCPPADVHAELRRALYYAPHSDRARRMENYIKARGKG
ncbi:MAG: hypothetical protein ACYC5N_10650, partial [Endomicrobiales bacterium]